MIIPAPKSLVKKNGQFKIDENTSIICKKAILELILTLTNCIEKEIGKKPKIRHEISLECNNCIVFNNQKSNTESAEAYNLNISSERIQVEYQEKIGAFYAIQTLKQLIYLAQINENGINVQSMNIIDEPRFKWRGFMLDDCRHFHGMERVKEMLDIMALLKMNVFHWHLTEDQGWRIEIKKYPKLTEIGSKRADTQIRHSRSKDFTGEPHSGFYTQEEIKEAIEYAKERFITIVPEIEIPGHSQAAIASYPELGCTGESVDVSTTFGIKDIVYCPGKSKTFKFWYDVLDEVMEVFPSEIIHIGGDEVPKNRWEQCSDCQAKIKNENLTDEEELQVFVTNSVASYLVSKGRRLMGWNEILDEGLEPNAICHYWAHDEGEVIDHIKRGRDTVVSKSQFTYLNSSYRRMSLEDVYRFDPMLKGLTREDKKHILGIESPCWTEWIPDKETFDFQVFPRVLAIAETGWTPKERKDIISFENRLVEFEKILDRFNIQYATAEERDSSLLARIRRFINKIF